MARDDTPAPIRSTSGTPGDAANDPAYPKYVIRYQGASVPETSNFINGPHTFVLTTTTGVKIKVESTRNEAVAGVPDLSITFTEQP